MTPAEGAAISLAADDYAFAPDPRRAKRVDRLVREELAASLETTFKACSGYLDWPAEQLEALLARLRAGPVRAAIMALYADLVEALFRDDLNGAQKLADELLALPPDAPGRLFTINDETLGAGQSERFYRIICDGIEGKLAFAPFSDTAMQGHAKLFDEACDLLAKGAPALAGEVAALTREIVLVDPKRPPSREIEIGGSSIFYLWGAAFISFNQPPTRLELAEALAHEAAHALLFGFTLGKPMVSNDTEARFSSPLRDDKRPMEGIVHAAYVIARLTWLMDNLLESGLLSDEEAASAMAWRDRNRRDFRAALEIIEAEARFTPAGQAAFAPAIAAMAAC